MKSLFQDGLNFNGFYRSFFSFFFFDSAVIIFNSIDSFFQSSFQVCFETGENFLQRKKRTRDYRPLFTFLTRVSFHSETDSKQRKSSREVFTTFTQRLERGRERERECFSPRMRIGIYGTIKKKQRTAEDEEVPFRNRAEPTDSSREIT